MFYHFILFFYMSSWRPFFGVSASLTKQHANSTRPSAHRVSLRQEPHRKKASTMDDAGDPSMGHYDDSNRAFLQALLARGTMTFEEGQKILAAIFSVQEGTVLLATF